MRFYVSVVKVNPTNNANTYLDLSYIEIINCPKFNGKYFSDYIYDDNYINKKEKRLVVYYSELKGSRQIKVTWFNNFDSVIIVSAK